ncbi:MAG TPA: hypothetical protein PL137_03920 [Nocardioides sp.]|nr:hypothetical protein [Nocardioides sp.]
MHTTPEDEALTASLHRNAHHFDGVDVTDTVLRTGRTRVRRTRAAGAVAALAVVGVAGSSSGLLGPQEPQRSTTGFASTTPSVPPLPPSVPPTPSAQQSLIELTCSGARLLEGESPVRIADDDPGLRPALGAYFELLVKHLDSERQHLQPVSGSWFSVDKTVEPCGVNGLGMRPKWTSSDSDGVGMVSIDVYRDWATAEEDLRSADPDWESMGTPPAGVVDAKVSVYRSHGGIGLRVAAEHSDGTVVIVTTSDRYTEEPTIPPRLDPGPMPTQGFSSDELLEAAADPGFELP